MPTYTDAVNFYPPGERLLLLYHYLAKKARSVRT